LLLLFDGNRHQEKYKYVLSVIDGIVREVYEVDRWEPVKDVPGRYEFFGHVAPAAIADLFSDRRIPPYYTGKGMANPIQYKRNMKTTVYQSKN
jgi:hypothetical protein